MVCGFHLLATNGIWHRERLSGITLLKNCTWKAVSRSSARRIIRLPPDPEAEWRRWRDITRDELWKSFDAYQLGMMLAFADVIRDVTVPVYNAENEIQLKWDAKILFEIIKQITTAPPGTQSWTGEEFYNTIQELYFRLHAILNTSNSPWQSEEFAKLVERSNNGWGVHVDSRLGWKWRWKDKVTPKVTLPNGIWVSFYEVDSSFSFQRFFTRFQPFNLREETPCVFCHLAFLETSKEIGQFEFLK